jgi:hypothetical protein
MILNSTSIGHLRNMMNMRGRSIIIPINRIVLNVVRMMMNVRRDHMMRGLRMRMWMVMDMWWDCLIFVIALLIIIWRKARWGACIDLISRSLVWQLKSQKVSRMIARSLILVLLLLLSHYLIEELATLLEAISPLNIRLLYLLAEWLLIEAKWLIWELIIDKCQACVVISAGRLKIFLVCSSLRLLFDILSLYLLGNEVLHFRSLLNLSLPRSSSALRSIWHVSFILLSLMILILLLCLLGAYWLPALASSGRCNSSSQRLHRARSWKGKRVTLIILACLAPTSTFLLWLD